MQIINNKNRLVLSQTQHKLREGGFSLVELMVAMVIGLLILGSLSSIFLSTNRSSVEMRKSTQQQENGRYASQLLYDDLMLAGYLGEFDSSPLISPTALPDICSTDMAKLLEGLPLHVQGINNATAPAPSCLSDLKTGTDIIVIKRASTCVAGSTGCDVFLDKAPHFQASLCSPTNASSELAALATSNQDYAANHFAFSDTSTAFTRKKTNCGTTTADVADIRRYLVHIYFIANNNNTGDGIPTLKRADIGAGKFSIVPLVDGIENMQVQYGIDTTTNGVVDTSPDGVPDSYLSAPTNVNDWRNAMAARVFLLSRSTISTSGYSDTRTYVLGDETISPVKDAYKRHVYNTAVQFVNPSWRRQ